MVNVEVIVPIADAEQGIGGLFKVGLIQEGVSNESSIMMK